MKWVLIILNLGYSYSTGGTSCSSNSQICVGTSTIIPSNKQQSESMDRDSCFKAAETVKRVNPEYSVSCEVRNP